MDSNNLSEEQLAGQRLMVGFDGYDLTPELKYYIETLKVGGIILFSRNILSPRQLTELCSSVQTCAESCGQPPLFISIDQEGGVVARLKEPFSRFPGNPMMQGIDDAVKFGDITSSELKQSGINMNMAPVMDVAPKGFKSIMADRMFGHDPGWVSRLGGAVIESLQGGGVMAVAKHFPGIGRTTLDSHLDLPVSDLTLKDLEYFDILPFKAAVEKKVIGIMLSHIRYEKIDKDWPASLSSVIARDILRGDLGFNGLVITDDLDMGAIEKHYDIELSIDRIFEADIDIALICHPGPKITRAFEFFKRKIQDKDRFGQKYMASVNRIMEIKGKWLSTHGDGGSGKNIGIH
jgi:beta-N-acetylhexosaminidase